MVTMIFLWLGVYIVTILTPSLFQIGKNGVPAYVGARDNLSDPGVVHGRAARAVSNCIEGTPVFLALALLALILPDTNTALAQQGALIAVLGRAAFLPIYMMGIPWVRSVIWMVSWGGKVMMALALV